MLGRNEMVVCEAELREWIQHYFDNVLFRTGASPRVDGVGYSVSTESFSVALTERKEEPDVRSLEKT